MPARKTTTRRRTPDSAEPAPDAGVRPVSKASAVTHDAPPPAEAPKTFRDLMSFRLVKASYYCTKPTYLSFLRTHKVTAVEWRLMGNLYADAPLPLARLAVEVDIQLAQASRTVSSLVTRGLVRSEADKKDGRSVQLSLTTEGRALYRRMFGEAVRRQERQLACLTAKELQVLCRALDKLADAGRAMFEEERLRP